MQPSCRRAFIVVACLTLPGSLGGCGQRYFSDRATNPVVGDYISYGTGSRRFGILSTAATRRSIVVQIPAERTQASLLCTEPPPDAVEAYANAISAAVSGSNKASDTTASVDLARSFATSAAPMLYRTQGLQMLRDSQYHLCNMYLNGVLSKVDYQRMFEAVMLRSAELIKAEMAAVRAAAGRSQSAVTPPNVGLPVRGSPGTGQAGNGAAGIKPPPVAPGGSGAAPVVPAQPVVPAPRS